MDLKEYAAQAKQLVYDFLETKKHYDKFIPGIIGRIQEFSTAGKGLRGALVLAHHNLYAGKDPRQAHAAAIAVELFHSGILIMDDIIDTDDLRRGLPTMHKQLENLDEHRLPDSKKGESFAICVGLITTYLAQELFSVICDKEVIKKMSHMYVITGFAEMKELLNDTNPDSGKKEIFDVYVNKTGKYTISMPSMIGAMLGGASQEDVNLLEDIGIDAGILFQLKDDMLEIEGSTEEIGKSIKTDITMNNKTYPRLILEDACSKEELKKLALIYGTKPTDEEVEFIRFLHKKYRTRDVLENTSKKYITRAKEKLDKLKINNPHLLFLLHYNKIRTK